MTGLIRNEMIKTFRTGFIRAALCIILAFCIILPVGTMVINRSDTYYYGDNDFYAEMAENADNEVEKKFYGVMSASELFFSDNGIAYGDWRYDEYQYPYQSILQTLAACELAKAGYKKTEAENWFWYECMNTEVTLNESFQTESSEDNYVDAFSLKPEELDKAIAKLKDMKSKLEKHILSVKIDYLYDRSVAERESEVESAKVYLSDAEKELAKHPDNAKFIYAKDVAKASLKCSEAMLWGAKTLRDGKYEYESWQYNAVNDIIRRAASEYPSSVIMDEALYNESDEAYYYGNYASYVKTMQHKNESADEAIALVNYALEKNIPIPECVEDSASGSYISDVCLAALLVSIFMIAIASTTLFNEYSSGSIRLLLIRPRSRTKILLSKLLTVVIYGAIAMAASMIVLFILDSICHKTGDMFTPILMMKAGGKISEVPVIVYALIKVMLKMFSSFAVVSGAFMLASLFAKGGIFALTLGSVFQCITAITTGLASELNRHLHGVFAYTIFPYVDMSAFYGNALSEYSYESFSLFEELFGNVSLYEFDAKLGAVIVAVHTVLFLVIAFVGFRKKQIKN